VEAALVGGLVLFEALPLALHIVFKRLKQTVIDLAAGDQL
jgi:hypothetical protein